MSKEINKSQNISIAPGLLIAGTNSGCGKTTVTLALMEAFRRKGIKVRPFKVGPDFIDPGLHRLILGVSSHNLDTWMLPPDRVKQLYVSASKGFDLSIVEGVMGLYDGASGSNEEGSSAQIAKLLGLKVLLIVNAKSMARSVSALIKGFLEFDPSLDFLGVILNNVGSKNHQELLDEALRSLSIDFVGFLNRNPDITIPSRHLGLITAEESPINKEFRDKLFKWISEGINLDNLYEKLKTKSYKAYNSSSLEKSDYPYRKCKIKKKKVLAVSWDRAFCFLYQVNLDLLRRFGVRIEFFSPLEDKSLPSNTTGIYLCGGYPELYAKRLSENRSILSEIKNFIEDNKVLYAECGGMLYLSKGIKLERESIKLLGVFPFWVKLSKRLVALGYREVRFLVDCFLAKRGSVIRGHEFHYSYLEMTDLEEVKHKEIINTYEVFNRKGEKVNTQGFLYKNCLASYVHLHFLNNPQLCENFVKKL